MAKENEKKFSGEMNAEELENVAGGWCATGGIDVDKKAREAIDSINVETLDDGGYVVLTNLKDGRKLATIFDQNGKQLGHDMKMN